LPAANRAPAEHRRHHAKTEEIRRWCASLSLILKLARRGAARLSRARLM